MNIRKLIFSALFAALTCVCTMAITIPTPTGGYVHAGDCFVILAGVFLGPLAGGLAGGIGSMFSDIFLGYLSYAPATFIIKFLAAFFVGMIYKCSRKISIHPSIHWIGFILGGIASSLIVITGYFLYEWLLTSNILSAAVSGILGNTFQGLISILLSALVYMVLPKSIMNTELER